MESSENQNENEEVENSPKLLMVKLFFVDKPIIID